MKHAYMLLGLLLARMSTVFAAETAPTEASAKVPAVSYRSAFEGYRSATEQSIGDWRALNDEVAAVGGHVGIMRGARPQQPAPAAGAPSSTPDAPAAAGHRH